QALSASEQPRRTRASSIFSRSRLSYPAVSWFASSEKADKCCPRTPALKRPLRSQVRLTIDPRTPQLALNVSSQFLRGFRHNIPKEASILRNDCDHRIGHQLRIHPIVVRRQNLMEECRDRVALDVIRSIVHPVTR